MITEVIGIVFLVATAVASIMYWAEKKNFKTKYGDRFSAIDWYQLHRKPWMPDDCRPCFSLWLGVVILMGVSLVTTPYIMAASLTVPPLAIFFLKAMKME